MVIVKATVRQTTTDVVSGRLDSNNLNGLNLPVRIKTLFVQLLNRSHQKENLNLSYIKRFQGGSIPKHFLASA